MLVPSYPCRLNSSMARRSTVAWSYPGRPRDRVPAPAVPSRGCSRAGPLMGPAWHSRNSCRLAMVRNNYGHLSGSSVGSAARGPGSDRGVGPGPARWRTAVVSDAGEKSAGEDLVPVSVLHALMTRVHLSSNLQETLDAVTQGVLDVSGFGIAAISVVRHDRLVETVSVAGSAEARAELLGSTVPLWDLERSD